MDGIPTIESTAHGLAEESHETRNSPLESSSKPPPPPPPPPT